MNDIKTIVTFLQKYSLDVLILSVVIMIVTNLIKLILPQKFSNFKGYIPFLLGIIFYALSSLLSTKELSVLDVLSRGVQSGGLATLIYAFYKHILKSKGDVKGAIYDLLKGIISSTAITDVAKNLSTLFSSELSTSEMKSKIEEILKENTEVDSDVLNAISKLIINVFEGKK